LRDGTIDYASTGTISTCIILGGTFDARGDAGGFTITQLNMYKDAKVLDPYSRITMTNPANAYFDVSPNLIFGGTPDTPVTLTL